MASSNSKVSESNSESQNLDAQTLKEAASDESKNGGEADQIKDQDLEVPRGGEGDGAEKEVEEEEDEEGECGFCLFMKGGGCRDSFTEWEKCVEEAEKNKEDMVEKCFQVTANLKKCMEAHADYYEPVLKAEKAAEEEVTKELEREAETKSEEKSSTSDSNARPEISEEQVNSR